MFKPKLTFVSYGTLPITPIFAYRNEAKQSATEEEEEVEQVDAGGGDIGPGAGGFGTRHGGSMRVSRLATLATTLCSARRLSNLATTAISSRT